MLNLDKSTRNSSGSWQKEPNPHQTTIIRKMEEKELMIIVNKVKRKA